MDQLKVVLEHKFWILSALAVLLPPIGWWVSTGDMGTQTDIRTKAIQGKVKSLDTLKDISKAANDDWIKGAKDVNVKLASVVDHTHKYLYDHQRPVMTWHPLVRAALDEAQVKYRGETAVNPAAFVRARRLFASRYVDMWRNDVYEVIKPFDMQANDGKVLCSEPNVGVLITRAPAEVWLQRQNMSAQEMWEAQEDLWMLHCLMKAVARVNEGSVNIDDARIKRLISATLRGGSQADLTDRRKKKETKNATGPGGAPVSLSLDFGTRRGGGESEYGAKALPMIESDDVFGSSEETSSQGMGGANNNKKGQSAGDAPGGTPYVKSDPGGKWRARGFVLRLVMDHQEIPKLITALTESPFPVEIYQVEHKPYEFKKNRQSAAIAAENEADQKKIKLAEERVNLAMNQVNLAEVMVAGVFIFYNEPAAPAAAPSTAPGKVAAPVPAPTATKAAPGTTTPPASAKPAAPAVSTSAASSQNNLAPGKAPNPAAGSSTAPKANTSTAPAKPSPTAPKPGQPTKT
ncbi:MAG TPA: hypothetical protein VFG04_30015 [Planctomycetaceae bacterium]|jgi:hypothetical protein|nr:hypothetical protein [Planctomycetaceae bacterium]